MLREFEDAETVAGPDLETLFTDVYHDVPRHLQEQLHQVREQVAKHPEEYPYLHGKHH